MAKEDKHFGTLGTAELRPGSTPRRWEPECGVRKLNERIHKESKFADDYKNLPFSFRKPPKGMGRRTALVCDNCGAYISGTSATVGVICRSCNKFSSVTEVDV
jgi:hypothetical protein